MPLVLWCTLTALVSARYGNASYRSRNPLRRFSHNARFAISAKLVAEHCGKDSRVLDYGAGDGHFLDILGAYGFTNVVGYDPIPSFARQDMLSTLAAVSPASCDCITCLETLEHLADDKLAEFFAATRRILKPDGVVIISVPVMIGPAVIPKTLPDIVRGVGRDYGYTVGNLVKSVLGRPPEVRRLSPKGIYYHMGFDHRRLRPAIAAAFRSVTELTSPFTALPVWANSQVFFICNGISSRPSS